MSNKAHYLWSTANRIGTQTIGFVGNVLIARQLSPDDYGLIAMVAVIIGIASNLADSGFGDCLIRKSNTDKKDFSTVLVFNVAASFLMLLIIVLIGPALANFFGRNELINITRVLGISIILRAIPLSELTRLRKELQFKTLAIIRISSSFISTTLAYILALSGFGYWALVFQAVSLGVIDILLIVVLSKWKPYLYFSIKRFKEMSGFSFNLLLSYLSNQIGANIYSFFIGKYHSAFSLGFYRQAQKLKDAPLNGLNAVIISTTYPLLAKEKEEKKRYSMFLNLLNRFLFLQFFICLFLLGSADSLIEILFGQKWLQTIPYFQLMILAYLFYPLTSLNYNIAKIYGHSTLYRNLAFLRNGLTIIALMITMKYEITTILYGQIIALNLSTILTVLFCGRIIHMGIFKQLKITITQLWIPGLATIAGYLIAQMSDLVGVKILIFTVSFFVVYVSLNEMSRQIVYKDFKLMLINNITGVLKK